MKQIYDFELNSPPVLNENMLRQKAEERRLQWQTALIAAAAVLMQVVIVLLGFSAIDFYPVLTALSFIYVIISTTGYGILAVVCTRKGGNLL
ncbi:MAG: hypothetical protein Q4B96_06925 [Bacillota bacterium]|nr:hypothetical protein [Bacillota bacterium]